MIHQHLHFQLYHKAFKSCRYHLLLTVPWRHATGIHIFPCPAAEFEAAFETHFTACLWLCSCLRGPACHWYQANAYMHAEADNGRKQLCLSVGTLYSVGFFNPIFSLNTCSIIIEHRKSRTIAVLHFSQEANLPHYLVSKMVAKYHRVLLSPF